MEQTPLQERPPLEGARSAPGILFRVFKGILAIVGILEIWTMTKSVAVDIQEIQDSGGTAGVWSFRGGRWWSFRRGGYLGGGRLSADPVRP